MLVCVAAFCLLVMEGHTIDNTDVTHNVNVYDPSSDTRTNSFNMSYCLSTCFGWNVQDGVPPANYEQKSNVDQLVIVLVVAVVRIVCLLLESQLLTRISGDTVHHDNIRNEVTAIFSSVSPLLLVISFMEGTIGVALGMHTQAWNGLKVTNGEIAYELLQ